MRKHQYLKQAGYKSEAKCAYCVLWNDLGTMIELSVNMHINGFDINAFTFT